MIQSLALQRENQWVHPSRTGENNDNENCESFYDLLDDFELIEASFLKQYGVRIREVDDMSWEEFCSLLSGIMPDTPLGAVVSIRSEKNPEVIKKFNKDQKRIRSEWILRRSKEIQENPNESPIDWTKMQKYFKEAFS